MFNFTLHVCANVSHGEHWCASRSWCSPTQHTTSFFCLPSTRIARCNCWNYYNDSNAKFLGIALTTYTTKIKNWNSANFKLFLAAIHHLCLIIILFIASIQLRSKAPLTTYLDTGILDKKAPADTKYMKTATMPALQQPWSDGEIQNLEIKGIYVIPGVYKVELLVLL